MKITATAAGDSRKFAVVEIEVRPKAPLVFQVNPAVIPQQSTIRDKNGVATPLAAMRDGNGVQSDFVVGQVLIRPKSEGDLKKFVLSYSGVVVGDNRIPDPPPELGITLSPERRKPTEFLVRVDLAKVNLSRFSNDAAQLGIVGRLDVSSEDGLRTLAAVVNAKLGGFSVSLDDMAYPDQVFPSALLNTEESCMPNTALPPIAADPGCSAGQTRNAFGIPQFQAIGSQSNLTLAWQFLETHGIQRRVRVAIIDDGFWLNPMAPPPAPDPGTPFGVDVPGNPRDTDLPERPIQRNFQPNVNLPGDDSLFAAGPNSTLCGGQPCFWHGNGAASVAIGLVNNGKGAAGTGGLIADPMLFKSGSNRSQRNVAIDTALAWGADVISMSWSYNCDSLSCRDYDRDHTPFDDAVREGNPVVFVASAGNNGENVGEPKFVHPCIEDHVICVGALNDNAATRQSYSNFGDGVDIFAPTNIPVMRVPAPNDNRPNGPAFPQLFGGTSASAPFVAGVAAMMKAINPNLSSDDVADILNKTAHQPGVGDVTRYIDAYAAVRKAAEGIEAVKDRYEAGPGNNTPAQATRLFGALPWRESNLNLHNGNDRDYFDFAVNQRSTLEIGLEYPDGLGRIPRLDLITQRACGEPKLVSNADPHRSIYTVPPGSYVFGVGNGPVNAYNLTMQLTSANPGVDDYEGATRNDTPTTARYLYSLQLVSDGFGEQISARPRVVIDPEASIDATLDSPMDVDYYIVRSEVPSVGEVVSGAQPVVQVSEFDAQMKLEVYNGVKPDGTPGSLVPPIVEGCGGKLEVRTGGSGELLVKISGGAGKYHFYNGLVFKDSIVPGLQHGAVHGVLHPGEPVEHAVRGAEVIYAFVADQAFTRLYLEGSGLHLQLYDSTSHVVQEGEPLANGSSESLNLESAPSGRIFVVRVKRLSASPEGSKFQLRWDKRKPLRSSANLIQNGGAEDGSELEHLTTMSQIPFWHSGSESPMAVVLPYGSADGVPTKDDPGPEDRGVRFFAGGPNRANASLQQDIEIPLDWREGINLGKVKFSFGGYLGGAGGQPDYATLGLTFLDAHQRVLGKFNLGPVTASERENKTGLWGVGTDDYVPRDTRLIRIDLNFQGGEGDFNDAYADELKLILREFSVSAPELGEPERGDRGQRPMHGSATN